MLDAQRGAVTGVRTPHGDIEAEYVVNCAGMWARQLGEAAGVNIPLQAAEHYYLITEPIDGVDATLPVLEDPASYGYFREEGGGLMLGLFEPVCAPWQVDGIPDDFSFGTLPPDWDRMAPVPGEGDGAHPGLARRPACARSSAGRRASRPTWRRSSARRRSCATTSSPPGLNSIGILTGGGIGRALAHWIVDGRPDIDVTGINIDRLHAVPAQPGVPGDPDRRVARHGLRSATTRAGRCAPPAAPSSRRCTSGCVAQRAYFRDVSGWESAGLVRPGGRRAEPSSSCPGAGRTGSRYWEAEHRAAREGVIVMDMSFMAKFLVQGRDAGPVLERLSANRVDGEPGVITYTQWLNEGGTLEADLTVTKLDDDRFWVVASDTAHRHARDLAAPAPRRRARVRHRRHVAATPRSTSRARARGSCWRP